MRRIALAFAVLALALPLRAAACGPGGCPVGGCGGPGASSVEDYYSTALLNAKRLGLSEGQVAELRRRLQERRRAEERLRQRLAATREELRGLIAGGQATEPEVDALLGRMRQLRDRLRELAHGSEEGPRLLTEAQRARLAGLLAG
ncbi:MAG: periplasmic heavy metal sensor, partial [Nitrospirae bacterium]